MFNKIYHRPVETILTIAWSIWNHRNNLISDKYDAKPGHIFNVAVPLMNGMILLRLVFPT